MTLELRPEELELMARVGEGKNVPGVFEVE